jgi:CHAD domain-containing protein
MKGFRITNRQTVKENINRILFEQVDHIIDLCESGQQDVHLSVHEIRKSIKRIRAVLRLIREEIGYSTYYRENAAYRDINRSISDLRTYDVLILTLENVQAELSRKLPDGPVEPLIRSIRDQRDEMLAEVFSGDETFRELAERVREAKTRIPDLPVRHNGFEAFSGGIFRMYRHGKEYLTSATKDHDMHHLHDMRKRTKYLWHQIQIVKPIYPGALGALARSLETITEKLGTYHDLAVLSGYLKKNGEGLEDEIREAFLDACEFKKSALLPGIFRKAGTAFGEKPEALVQRLGEYWKIYYGQT